MITFESSIKFSSKWRNLLPRKHLIVCLLVSTMCGAISPPLAAADRSQDSADGMAALAPLRNLLAQVHDTYPGRVLEVELEREESGRGAIWVYEVKLLTVRGSVLKLEYDAVDLKLLKLKGRAED